MPRDFRITHDPVIAALRFCPYQLARAREMRGLTKSELARRIQKSASAISQFESGEARPDPTSLTTIALALQFPVGFFSREPYVSARPSLDMCHFRSLRSVPQSKRREAIRTGELLLEVVEVLQQGGVRFVGESIGGVRRSDVKEPEQIELFTEQLRLNWGLGLGPLLNPITLLESKGVWVLPLHSKVVGVDAFSTWIGSRPFVFLETKESSRMHFDSLHELAHLLLHEDAVAGDASLERQANRFSSAFLLPRRTFGRECPTSWDLQVFRALKREWRVSIQALLYRGLELGRLSQWSVKRAYIELSQKGMRLKEPDEWTLHGPQILSKALSAVASKLPTSEIANELAISEELLSQIGIQPSA